VAQRHEIEAWVNPSAWDNRAAADRLITLIEKSGSDFEGDWMRLMHEVENTEMVAEAIYNAETGPGRVAAWAELPALSQTRERMLGNAVAAIEAIDGEFAKALS